MLVLYASQSGLARIWALVDDLCIVCHRRPRSRSSFTTVLSVVFQSLQWVVEMAGKSRESRRKSPVTHDRDKTRLSHTRVQYRPPSFTPSTSDQPYSLNLSPSCFDDCHWTSRHGLCHRSRVWASRPGCAACWCVLLSFSSLSSRPEVLMDYEEGVGGIDSSMSVREAQPVVSQAETLDETSSSACCCIPSGVLRPFTSRRGGSNVEHAQRNVSDQSTQTGQGSSQAEAQIRAYFLIDHG
jgi:hypothetical protein